MCSPTVALTALSVGSSVLQYQQAKSQQKAQYTQQKRQNQLAKDNAMQRYASEQLKIRQIEKQSSQKSFDATLKSRKARARFKATAGDAGVAMTGSTNALLADYYRTEGNYKASLARNMDINISQFERNMEAIQFGQEAQSTYVQPPNSALLFASSVINVGNTYFGMQNRKANSGLMTNSQKNNYV